MKYLKELNHLIKINFDITLFCVAKIFRIIVLLIIKDLKSYFFDLNNIFEDKHHKN